MDGCDGVRGYDQASVGGFSLSSPTLTCKSSFSSFLIGGVSSATNMGFSFRSCEKNEEFASPIQSMPSFEFFSPAPPEDRPQRGRISCLSLSLSSYHLISLISVYYLSMSSSHIISLNSVNNFPPPSFSILFSYHLSLLSFSVLFSSQSPSIPSTISLRAPSLSSSHLISLNWLLSLSSSHFITSLSLFPSPKKFIFQ